MTEVVKAKIAGLEAEFYRELRWRENSQEPVQTYRLVVHGDAGSRFDYPFGDRDIDWWRVSVNEKGESRYVGVSVEAGRT